METKIAVGEDENVKKIRTIFGGDISEMNIHQALFKCGHNPDAAINFILDTPGMLLPSGTTRTSTGARISAPVKQENDVLKPMVKVKEEPDCGLKDDVKMEDLNAKEEGQKSMDLSCAREMPIDELRLSGSGFDKDGSGTKGESVVGSKDPDEEDFEKCWNLLGPKKRKAEEKRVTKVIIEDGDFAEEEDWLLAGRTMITGLSTTKGRKLENNEIVHLSFPSPDSSNGGRSYWGSAKAAAAIARFSTKRSGEVILHLEPTVIGLGHQLSE